MTRQHYTPEEIIDKLREAEVLLNKGQSVQHAARMLLITMCSAMHPAIVLTRTTS